MHLKFTLAIFIAASFFINDAAAQEKQIVQPKIISAGVVNGRALDLPKPVFPAAAQAIGASGSVDVQVTIDEEGNVISAEAKSGHPLLQAAAVEAARLAKFKPTLLSGKPVKITGRITYNFAPAKPPVKDEVPIWAIGMFFSFLQNADADFLKEIGDEQELDAILTEMSKDIPPEMAAEKPLFEKVAKSKGDARRAAIAELTQVLKKHLNEAEIWNIELGENLGLVLLELVKQVKNMEAARPINEPALRANLQKIKVAIETRPANASPDTVKKFAEVAKFADAPALKSRETLAKLHENIAPLFAIFDEEN